MNEKPGSGTGTSGRKAGGKGHGKGHGNGCGKGRSKRGGRPDASPLEAPLAADEKLTSTAARLLDALNEPGALGRPDLLENGAILVSRSASGLSLSAGRFPAEAALILERRELVAWTSEASGSAILRITPVGSSYAGRAESSGEPRQEQRRGVEPAVILTGEGRDYLLANQRESPLEWLHRRKGRDGRSLIGDASYHAGERLRLDIATAEMLPGITSRWEERSAGRGPGEAMDRMIEARQRVRHAFDAVGTDFSDLLTDLCGFLKGLEQIERERGWPPRSAKVVIDLALRRLAEHYGLEGSAHGPATARGIRAWQAIVIEGGRS